MFKLNFTKRAFTGIVFFTMISLRAFPGTLGVSTFYNGHYSDYYLTTSWTNLPCGNFMCSCDNYIDFRAGDTSGGSQIYTVLGGANGAGQVANGSFKVILGPGAVHPLGYVRLSYHGVDHNRGCTCTVSAGLCPEVHVIHDDDQGDRGSATTSEIYAPDNLTATNGTGVDYVDLTWHKASDIPDSMIVYKIYRDNVLIATLPANGDSMGYHDPNLSVSTTYNYYIQSYTYGWGGHTSSPAYVTGSTFSADMQATDGTYYNKSTLSWLNLSAWAVNDIEIRRNGVQIAIVNKNTTHYNDFDGTEGVKYLYEVAAIDANNVSLPAYKDSGYSRPNGVLSGYVRSVLGTGITGVTLTATGIVDSQSHTYSAVTDATGYYKINDVYYDTQASYTVVPSKGTDMFNPPSITRSLDVNNYNNTLADIFDTTVFTVSGTMTYANTNGCPVGGAKLYVNGAYTNTTTNVSGAYSFIAQQPGYYQVSLQYYNHTFDSVSRTVYVSGNTSGIAFLDTKKDTLLIDLKGGCHNQIADSASFEVISDPDPAHGAVGCFDSVYHFNGFDPVVLVLPAQKYRVTVASAYDPLINLNITAGLAPIDLDLTKRDTVQLNQIDTSAHITPAYNDTSSTGVILVHHPADTTHVIDTVLTTFIPYHAARFVYHGPLTITLTNLDSICTGFIVEENNVIPMGIQVKEQSTYHSNVTSCYQDTGTVRIFDNVSGAGLSYVQLANGRVVYQLIPGEPNVPDNSTTHQYQKLLNVFVSSGSQSQNLDAWMTITGDKTLSSTFVSKTPPMPLMVLHDPPGSNSYASYEKDSSFNLNVSNYLDTTNNNGGYLGIKVGKTFTVPFGGAIPGVYFNTTITGADGHNGNAATSTNVNFTSTQTITTSGDPQFVGRDADVFVGGTVNTKYAVAFDLTVTGCTVHVDTVLIWGLDSVTSQFVYTGIHIQQTLLPQLYTLKAIAVDTMKAYFQNQINMWNQVLKNDSAAIATSNYTHNISFSSGLSYDYTAEQDTTFENNYTYASTHDVNFSVGAGISDAALIDINAGYNLSVHTESGGNNTSDATHSSIFTYHLEDDVPGNFYSVDIGSDKNFGSPVFRMFGGTSACPHEEGTQFRDAPTLSITPGAIYNVPATTPASFVAQVGNQSESFETRTYNVQLDPNTNLDGAIVKIGGQDITQNPASFTIPSATSINAALTVQKGPFADYYNDLGIIISSPCDPNISTTVPITVHFQSTCSDVSLALPTNNWLVNSSSHDTLIVAFSGYNAANPNLQEIGLQYRVAGSLQAWLNGPIVPVASLIAPYQTIPFNVTNLPDGNYEIRAYARCLTPANILSFTYSPTLSGVIDRRGFALFGTPQPSNGILNRGDNISIQFNENIDCNQLYGHITTSLHRADNGALILDTFVCTGSGLILTPNPSSLLDSLDGKIVIASVDDVYDANGNGLSNPIQWSFLVNRAQVYWNPSNVSITNVVGTSASGIGTLLNTAPTTQSFTLTHYPSWLTPSKLSDAITPNGIDSIRFTVNGPLNPGSYIDTVIATVGGLQAKLFVRLDVVKPQPNWSVNPNNYQYSMSITSNFSLTALNAPLSTDGRDMIAVFKGDECRGVANITYDPFSSRYAAFLTVYSNATQGDTLTFRMWDAIPGTEYQALERLTFISNGIVGQAVSPYILHPEGEFQTLAFSPGWNWFSLNVVSPDMSPKNVLAHLHPDTVAIVKTTSTYTQYAPSLSAWEGTLNAFDIAKSYMIQLSHPDTIHLLGQQVTTPTTISVAHGWNWLGYPHQDISTAATYLANANPADSDLLKTQTQFTQYHGGGWSGSLDYMYPGQGYKLKAGNSFNFVLPPDRSLPSWSADENLFQQNQSVTADLRFNGVSTTQSHYLVGAFANGICIGTSQPLYIPALNAYRVFITVHGDTANAGQAISFKVYDTDNDIEYAPSYDPISVVPDTTVARVEAPYVINVDVTGITTINYTDGYSLLQNVPNPFNKNTSIQYAIPAAQHVSITLYDEQGRLIAELVNATQSEGIHEVSFAQEDLQSGVYMYQMKAGDFVKTRRMLIIK